MALDSIKETIDFVIITALEEELDAVLDKLPNAQKLSPSAEDIRVYYRVELPVTFPDLVNHTYMIIALSLLNMGRVEAANATSDAIRRWQPRYVILVGIAGGIGENEVRVGDVLISDQIIDYELQKLTPEGDLPRDSIHRADPRLIIAAQNLRGRDWLNLIKEKRPEEGQPKRVIGPIATGDKVIARKEVLLQITKRWPKLIGVEMEAGGAASASFQAASGPGFFMVRGVSDLADENKDSDKVKNWRLYACDVAAAYTITLLQSGPVPPITRIVDSNASQRGTNPDDNRFQSSASGKDVRGSRKPITPILPQLDDSRFTGRGVELQKLKRLLIGNSAPKVCSIVSLSGTGGIGKSALAVHFAELHKADFPDGIIGLRVDGKKEDAIAREFARHSGEEIGPDDERDASTIMQEVFAHRRALLIFDNAENANIKSLRPGGKRCAVIVTTRDRNLPLSLDIPTDSSIDLPPLPDSDSLILLKQFLGAERIDADLEAAFAIIELVGHLPLALQIVGATLRLQSWRSLTDYANSLREERARLSKLRIHGDSFLDVRASFELSLKLLINEEIDFFACLSVCAQDGFSLWAAKAAVECSDTTVHEHLGRLYQLSLLNRSQVTDDQFVFHPLIRLFAQELADDRSLKENAASRHAQFYIELIRSGKFASLMDVPTLSKEMDDIILAAEWLLTKEQPDYEFLICLEPLLQQYGYWQDAAKLMAGFFLIAEQAKDWNAITQIRIQQAKYLSLRGEWKLAKAALDFTAEEITKIDHQENRLRCETMHLNTLGGIYLRQGQLNDAEQAFRDSASLEERLGREAGLAKALTSLGGVLQRRGHFEEAAVVFEKSIGIEERRNNTRGLAMVLNSRGGVLKRLGRFDKAVTDYQRSLDLLIELDDHRGQAMVLNSLGGAFEDLGKFDKATTAYQDSLVIEKKIRNTRGQAMVLNSLGGVLQRLGRFDEAEDAFRRSYEISEPLGDQRSLAMVLNSLGGVLQRLGRFDEAEDAFRRSYEISEPLGDQRSLAMVLNSLGGVLQRLGRFDEAEDAFRRSYELLVETGDDRGQAMVLNSLGGVLQRLGRFDEAEQAFLNSITIGEKLRDRKHLAMVHTAYGRALLSQENIQQAILELGKGFELDERLRNKKGVGIVAPVLIRTFMRQNRIDEAMSFCKRALLISPKDKILNGLYSQLLKSRRK
jgi:tetratricopeptide (TPR) repeat protein/nucleoside phosphorylase